MTNSLPFLKTYNIIVMNNQKLKESCWTLFFALLYNVILSIRRIFQNFLLTVSFEITKKSRFFSLSFLRDFLLCFFFLGAFKKIRKTTRRLKVPIGCDFLHRKQNCKNIRNTGIFGRIFGCRHRRKTAFR